MYSSVSHGSSSGGQSCAFSARTWSFSVSLKSPKLRLIREARRADEPFAHEPAPELHLKGVVDERLRVDGHRSLACSGPDLGDDAVH
jgi:hypothetical protein